MSRLKSDDDCLWTSFKNEFRLENFSLNFEKNSQFRKKEPEVVLEYYHTTIWPCCNKLVYLIYRIAIAIYYTIWFIESIVRNAEMVSNDIKFKNKINIFSIHPWPLYMTSWSLTILFVHLWIAAFISLYFYSINDKSRLAKFFSYLFGPFSCSRPAVDIPSRHNHKHKSCFSSIEIRKIFFKKTETLNLPNHSTTQNPEGATKINLLSAKQHPIRIETKNISTDIEANNEIIFFPQQACSLGQGSTVTRSTSQQTYCDNKSHCNIPSSYAISNAQAWKLWIDTHVPNIILILIKISWLLNNIVAISALIVTTIYFGYAYIVDLEAEPTWAHELGNVHRHGINSLVALVDVIMLAYPIRILHFIYVMIYGWVYAFVTFLYWLSDPKEHVVYDLIDYKNPLTIVFGYIFLTILVFLMQITHFLAYRLKVLIKTKYFEKDCSVCDESSIPASNITDVNSESSNPHCRT